MPERCLPAVGRGAVSRRRDASSPPPCHPGPAHYPSAIADALTDRMRSDVAEALKAGEKERVGALRVVLSELQKASKEGGDDDVAVLRRERKRRLDAAAQFRAGGRPELAEQEGYEAAMIAGYLPAGRADGKRVSGKVREVVAG